MDKQKTVSSTISRSRSRISVTAKSRSEKNLTTTKSNSTKNDDSKFATKQLLGKADLDIMLYKLKNYYDLTQIMKQTKTKEIGNLMYKRDLYEESIREVHELGNINCDDINKPFLVSVQNSKTTKESKENIQEKLVFLNAERDRVYDKYQNEINYSYTLSGMIDSDKSVFIKTNDEILTITRKINSIAVAKKNLDVNIDTAKKKEENFRAVHRNLKAELKKMNEIMLIQEKGRNQIDSQLFEKKKELDLDNKRFDERSIALEKESRMTKFEVQKEKKEFTEKLKHKIKKETGFVKTILGLYVLQKYFINHNIEEGFDHSSFESNLDFKQFDSDKVLIVDQSDKVLSTQDCSRDQDNTTFDTINSHKKSKNRDDTHTANTVIRVLISELKRKHDEISFNYGDLFEFYKKLTSRIDSFKNVVNGLNLKQINLEIVKDTSTRRVNEILTKNKDNNLNLTELLEQNSKFKNFMKSFRIDPRDYPGELNQYIATNDFTAFETDFYSRSLDFISDIKIVFESIYNKCKAISLHPSKSIMDKVNEYMSSSSVDFDRISKSLVRSNSSYLNELMYYYKASRESNGFSDVEEELLVKGDQLVKYLDPEVNEGLHMRWLLKLDIEFASQVFFSYESLDIFISLVTSALKLMKTLETELSIQATAKMRKTLTKKKTMRTGLDIYSGINIETEPVDEGNDLDNSYFSLEGGFDTKRMKTEGNKRDFLFTTSTFASEKDSFSRGFIKKGTTAVGGVEGGWLRTIKSSAGTRKINKFIDKFYKPYVEKMHYNIALNEKISDIKKMTSKDAKTNNYLEKKNKEIVKISHDLIIYNNPTINLNTLSKETYNSFIKYIMKTQHSQNRSASNLHRPKTNIGSTKNSRVNLINQ